MTTQPFLMLSNDDGIASPGLLAAARALAPLGKLLVVAPKHQHSGWGRAMPREVGPAEQVSLDVPGDVEAWSVDATPAMSVRWALYTRVTATPDLVISGINFGENIGVSIPISGTVGAACEAASIGPRAIAVSLQTDDVHYYNHSADVDFDAAAEVTARIARLALERGLPDGVDVLNVNVPRGAEPDTAWRWTRVSRHHYFESVVHSDAGGERRIAGWRTTADPDIVEPDSDIRALALDEVVSISPLTVDPTAHEGKGWLDGHGRG